MEERKWGCWLLLLAEGVVRFIEGSETVRVVEYVWCATYLVVDYGCGRQQQRDMEEGRNE